MSEPEWDGCDPAELERLTVQLCRIDSVNGQPGEAGVVAALGRYLEDRDGGSRLGIHIVDSAGDRLGRPNLLAHLPGTGGDAVVLLGHVDTVGTEDYGAVRPLALDPVALTERVAAGAMGPDLAKLAASGNWLFGRGVLDMKSGLAVAAGVLLAQARSQAPGPHLIFLACADEEASSLGARTLGPWLGRYLAERHLRLAGVIKTDFTASIRPGQHRRIYTGSVGKLLLGVSVFGLPSHAGEPEAGLDPNRVLAEITGRLTYRIALADEAPDGERAPVVVTLAQSDHKRRYDVQTALSAHALYNLLQVHTAPVERLEGMVREIRELVGSLAEPLAGLSQGWPLPVFSWPELWAVADPAAQASVRRLAARLAGGPPHTVARRLVEHLVGRLVRTPAVVVYLAAPPIPRVRSSAGLGARLRGIEAEGRPIETLGHFPFISDLSFMVASADGAAAGADAYLPQLAGRHLPEPDLPAGDVLLAGPCGDGAHRPDERVERGYTFSVLPGLIQSLIERLSGDPS